MTVRPGQTNKFAEGYASGGPALYGGLGGGVMVSPGNGTGTVIGVGAGKSLGKIKKTLLPQEGVPRRPRENWSGMVEMGPSITSVPQTRPQNILWWGVFTAMMSFIAYVIVMSLLFR